MNQRQLVKNVFTVAAKYDGTFFGAPEVVAAYDALEAAVGYERAQYLVVHNANPVAGPQLLEDIYETRARRDYPERDY